ncbi:MAG: hypothetical protein FWB93_01505 [Oscillospiraceae bacterium]|nr:hypothetical protein [Oscillospiraceae bacterium]
MKKLLTLIIVLAMLPFMLVACGDDSDSTYGIQCAACGVVWSNPTIPYSDCLSGVCADIYLITAFLCESLTQYEEQQIRLAIQQLDNVVGSPIFTCKNSQTSSLLGIYQSSFAITYYDRSTVPALIEQLHKITGIVSINHFYETQSYFYG